MKDIFKIKIWGARGSIAVPGKSTVKYGGNTPCVEVRCGKNTYILDAGSGLRELGKELLKRKEYNIKFLFSHFHWDHIQGFPFFLPVYNKKFKITLYGESKLSYSFEHLFSGQVMFPYFPVSLDEMDAQIKFIEITKNDVIKDGKITIKMGRLNHPNGCIGYRFEYNGKSFVYATDTEHFNCIDRSLLNLAKGCDVLIYDANYTEEEYSGEVGFPRTGWGHSTWQQGVKLAKAAKIKKLILFHHDQEHDDEMIDKIQADAQKEFPETYAAYEGMEIFL
ncbi:MAG: MBL fold metallo-hydrolase [Candidatus Schekmanbacteria bacterium]|nr:MAG: MBL fold metallo-hydrolase [Candidatus Schekmanbacteria bacterium]